MWKFSFREVYLIFHSFLPVQNAETADAEIKVLSADNLELLQIPDLSPGVGQNIYIYRNAD